MSSCSLSADFAPETCAPEGGELEQALVGLNMVFGGGLLAKSDLRWGDCDSSPFARETPKAAPKAPLQRAQTAPLPRAGAVTMQTAEAKQFDRAISEGSTCIDSSDSWSRACSNELDEWAPVLGEWVSRLAAQESEHAAADNAESPLGAGEGDMEVSPEILRAALMPLSLFSPAALLSNLRPSDRWV
mmetsp:Transcript_31543/g.80440  ORF Transcript_31543/g.80440 Transcript_31543/m.80440 type:complete len:187 (-) Transcript_31543:174-734(-)